MERGREGGHARELDSFTNEYANTLMFLEPEHQYWSLLAYSQPRHTLKVTVGCSPVLLSPWELKP